MLKVEARCWSERKEKMKTIQLVIVSGCGLGTQLCDASPRYAKDCAAIEIEPPFLLCDRINGDVCTVPWPINREWQPNWKSELAVLLYGARETGQLADIDGRPVSEVVLPDGTTFDIDSNLP